mmetsp:Transcript_37964/g.96008  ORF Transcript_37964/g.96008 Transcript_37964/m.96008 type:complete len:1095 (-) Transcript_37964:202-3486(-)
MARGSGQKRRQAAAPGGTQRPPKRVAGKGGRRPADLYEAEDSDPDEVKDTRRYDRVENYEYEMPSDFEDEEIDEDLAFTEEDKKKYAGWFSDEEAGSGGSGGGGEDEGEDEGGSSDLDMRLLDSDEELGQDENDDDEDEDEEEDGPEEQGGDDDDDDGLLAHLGGDDDEEEGSEGEGEEGEDDDDAYAAMMAEVTGRAAPRGAKAQAVGAGAGKPRKAAPLVDEAYPESEFGLNPGAASAGGGGDLTLAELMRGLGGEGRRKLPPAARKLLDKMSGGAHQAVAAPLPRAVKERTERKAGYDTTSKDVAKWQPLVKANREAPSLAFTAARDEVPRVNTTAALVAGHTPEEGMEAEVAALLQAAGAASAHAVAATEEALGAKELTLEEARERRERLAKLRSLLFYHELKAKRVKAIKSKEYHRKAAKAAKRKAGRLGDEGAVEAALAAAGVGVGGDEGGALAAEREEAEEAEFERAKERLTLKHRNTSRWARRALKRGATIIDPGTKAAVAEQLAMGEALRKRIEGKRPGGGSSSDEGGSDTDASTSASDGEGEGEAGPRANRGMSSKAKAAALELLAGGGPEGGEGEVPRKGLLALPFMARALERKRVAAQQEAAAVLAELEQEGEQQGGGAAGGEVFGGGFEAEAQGGSGAAARLRFGGGLGPAGGEGGAMSEDDGGVSSDEYEDTEAKAERLGARLQGEQQAAQAQQGRQKQPARPRPTAADEADLDAALEARAGGGGRGPAAADLPVPAGAASTRGKGKAGASMPHEDLLNARTASHAAAGPSSGSQQQPPFIAAKKFTGAKAGYAFKRGPRGVGYYLDAVQIKKHQSASQPPVRVAGDQSEAGAPAPTQAAARAANGGPAKTAGSKHKPAAAANGHVSGGDDEGGSDGEAGAREGMKAAPGSAAERQRALISMAFAGDDVEAEFEAGKAAEVAAELPHIEEPSSLPGWGAWSAQQRDPKWMRDARAKAAREREKAAAGRTDAKLQHVVLTEKWDKKAMSKYAAQAVPYPFDSRETYERSIRQPLGRQYNPDTAFRDLTRPAILKNTGVVIEPIRYTKPLAEAAHEVTAKSTKAKVLTVAGGVMKKPKKQRG